VLAGVLATCFFLGFLKVIAGAKILRQNRGANENTWELSDLSRGPLWFIEAASRWRSANARSAARAARSQSRRDPARRYGLW